MGHDVKTLLKAAKNIPVFHHMYYRPKEGEKEELSEASWKGRRGPRREQWKGMRSNKKVASG